MGNATGLVGELMQSVGGVVEQRGASLVDDQRAARLEKLKTRTRKETLTEERGHQAGLLEAKQTREERLTKEERAYLSGEAEKKRAATSGRVTLKSTTKNDDGTLTMSYSDGTAEILDPETRERTRYGALGEAKNITKQRGAARAEADSMFEKINDGPLWFNKLDLTKFNDSEDLAKARMADMIMEGRSDSEIMEFMLSKGAPAGADIPKGLPDAAAHPNKTVKDTTTGKRYKSDGTTWTEL